MSEQVSEAGYRVLVVDDEPPARAKVVRLLGADERVLVVGEATDGVDALEKIEALAPDIVVLDIQMPGLDGFEVLDALDGITPFAVIFSTAYDTHALRAFDANAVDYLLKPYDADRIGRAIDRAIVGCNARRLDHAPGLLKAALPATRQRLALRTEGTWVSVVLCDISCVTADNKHTEVVLRDRTRHRVRRSLREIAERAGRSLVRVHRSALVNPDAVTAIEPLHHGDALLHLVDGSTTILSRTFRAELLQRWHAP